jgi:hypothetical protein
VSGYFRDDETGQYVVSFNPKWPNFMKLATLIDWSERKALEKQPGQVVWAICQPRQTLPVQS